MDGKQFDGLLRGLTSARSRRGAVVRLLGGAVGLLGLTATEAKHHKKKHHKKKHGGSPPASPPASPPPLPVCTPACQGKTCGEDGCGGSCGTCGAVPCVTGACSCAGKPDSTDCGGGRTCSGELCAVLPTCQAANSDCETNAQCCSGMCDANFQGCEPGGLGKPCTSAFDCVSFHCVG